MAHTGKFKLDGKEAEVLSMSYSLYRDTDDRGRPANQIRRCEITLTIASDDKLKNAVVEWLDEGNKKKDGRKGEIIIDDESNKEFKKIEFENGFVISYNENYSYGTSNNLQETFTISAEKVNIGAAKFDFKWPKA